jgi:hypothetical protein
MDGHECFASSCGTWMGHLAPSELACHEHVIGWKGTRDGYPDRTFERARISDLARGDGVSKRLGGRDDAATPCGNTGLSIASAHRIPGTRWAVQLPGHHASIGLDKASTGGEQI